MLHYYTNHHTTTVSGHLKTNSFFLVNKINEKIVRLRNAEAKILTNNNKNVLKNKLHVFIKQKLHKAI